MTGRGPIALLDPMAHVDILEIVAALFIEAKIDVISLYSLGTRLVPTRFSIKAILTKKM